MTHRGVQPRVARTTARRACDVAPVEFLVAFELGDVREVSVKPAEVEPVTDDKDVGDREAHVVELDLHLSALDLVDEDARAEAFGMAGLEVALEVRERQPRVDDVLDD